MEDALDCHCWSPDASLGGFRSPVIPICTNFVWGVISFHGIIDCPRWTVLYINFIYFIVYHFGPDIKTGGKRRKKVMAFVIPSTHTMRWSLVFLEMSKYLACWCVVLSEFFFFIFLFFLCSYSSIHEIFSLLPFQFSSLSRCGKGVGRVWMRWLCGT